MTWRALRPASHADVRPQIERSSRSIHRRTVRRFTLAASVALAMSWAQACTPEEPAVALVNGMPVASSAFLAQFRAETSLREHAAEEPEHADPEEVAPEPEVEQPVQKKPVDTAKYWLTERSVGEFSRSFNFPTRVEQDLVSASFKDGILTVVVPKAKKHETRRIAVN